MGVSCASQSLYEARGQRSVTHQNILIRGLMSSVPVNTLRLPFHPRAVISGFVPIHFNHHYAQHQAIQLARKHVYYPFPMFNQTPNQGRPRKLPRLDSQLGQEPPKSIVINSANCHLKWCALLFNNAYFVVISEE